MALYAYVKAKPKRPFVRKKTFSVVVSLLGLSLISYVTYPILAFEITSQYKYSSVVSGVPATRQAVLGDQTSIDTSQQPVNIDFTKIENWLPQRPQGSSNAVGRVYFLSIPKLRIKDAVVTIAGESLEKSLIHYGGTAIPGDYGNTVIFGHSILPQLYNPANYKSIFSLLPELDNGDEFFVKFDGITYRYVIFEMRVVTPEDVSVLEQRYDSSYISLITCVPPGTYWKRLLVKARLERY